MKTSFNISDIYFRIRSYVSLCKTKKMQIIEPNKKVVRARVLCVIVIIKGQHNMYFDRKLQSDRKSFIQFC